MLQRGTTLAAAGDEEYQAAMRGLEEAQNELEKLMGQGFIDTRKDGIQAQKEWLEEQTKQKEEGETGLGLGDAYGLIGSFQASLENDKERLERDALSIVMGDGEKISSYQDSAQRERLEELQAQYQALEEQYGATDSEEMQRKIGAKMGALLAEAQIIAANEYNASEGAQLMQESNLALVQGIRDDSVLQKEYYNAGYTMGEEFSQGILAARMENAFSPVDYGLAPEEGDRNRLGNIGAGKQCDPIGIQGEGGQRHPWALCLRPGLCALRQLPGPAAPGRAGADGLPGTVRGPGRRGKRDLFGTGHRPGGGGPGPAGGQAGRKGGPGGPAAGLNGTFRPLQRRQHSEHGKPAGDDIGERRALPVEEIHGAVGKGGIRNIKGFVQRRYFLIGGKAAGDDRKVAAEYFGIALTQLRRISSEEYLCKFAGILGLIQNATGAGTDAVRVRHQIPVFGIGQFRYVRIIFKGVGKIAGGKRIGHGLGHSGAGEAKRGAGIGSHLAGRRSRDRNNGRLAGIARRSRLIGRGRAAGGGEGKAQGQSQQARELFHCEILLFIVWICEYLQIPCKYSTTVMDQQEQRDSAKRGDCTKRGPRKAARQIGDPRRAKRLSWESRRPSHHRGPKNRGRMT